MSDGGRGGASFEVEMSKPSQKVNRSAARRSLHRLVRCGAWQHASRDPDSGNMCALATPAHGIKTLEKARAKTQRVARTDLAREVRLPPRALSRTGLQLTLSSPAGAAARTTTDVKGHREVTQGAIGKLRIPHT